MEVDKVPLYQSSSLPDPKHREYLLQQEQELCDRYDLHPANVRDVCFSFEITLIKKEVK